MPIPEPSPDRPPEAVRHESRGDPGLQRALMNILEDFDSETKRLEQVQSATLNVLEDFDAEKERLKDIQRATLNIFEDFDSERVISEQSQRALLNILEDMDTEKTKVAEANQQLETVNQQLENATLAKDRFLASMSHELRTPMNAILGFTGMLLMKLSGPLTPDQEKQLKTIKSSAKHLLSLINDLLDLAKIESGKVELQMEPVLCQDIVHEVAGTLAPIAESKGLKLVVNDPETDVVVLTDRRALTQIVLNLANNAIKFTEKGFIRLELRRLESEKVFAEISVTDSGMGIRPEDQTKLFKAFAQLESPSARPQEGTGLGLYLSQRLSGLLGGQINFESKYGEGSKFAVLIPA